LLVTQEGLFLAPDNGLLTYVVREGTEYRAAARGPKFLESMEVAVPGGCAAYTLSNQSLWRDAVSDTFHGRDIFAPVAAHLTLGTPPEQVGEPLHSLVCLYIPHPQREGNTLLGHVVHVDGFGNLVTTVEGSGIGHETVEVVLKGHRIHGVSRSYAQGPDILAIVGSHGYLEIAARDGSAARELGASVGDEVVVRW
jgi:S-adenosylmethionine hydrolase